MVYRQQMSCYMPNTRGRELTELRCLGEALTSWDLESLGMVEISRTEQSDTRWSSSRRRGRWEQQGRVQRLSTSWPQPSTLLLTRFLRTHSLHVSRSARPSVCELTFNIVRERY